MVDLLNLTIRKCCKYQTWVGVVTTLRNFAKIPLFLICVNNLLMLLLDQSFFLHVPLGAAKMEFCHLSVVR